MNDDRNGSIEALRAERDELRVSLDRRFEELALLTRELEAQREAVEALQRRAEAAKQALRDVNNAVAQGSDDERRLIEGSGWFDADWYRQHNPDVTAHPEYADDPLAHFLRHGAAEGRWPCRAFDPAAYANAYPDVRLSDFNPLVHFLRIGQYEQRDPAPDR